MGGCPLCNESETKHRILFESDNFIVFPTLGQIVEGYLLIASKEHHISVGEVPGELYPELESVKEKVKNVLADNYAVPLFFEHGPISKIKRGGCCIDHAHIHAVPVKVDVLKELSKHFPYTKIDSYKHLKKKSKNQEPYFFLEDHKGSRFLFDIPSVVPSQYIRKVIASKIGKPEIWDWRVYEGLDRMEKTLVKLKDKFHF